MISRSLCLLLACTLLILASCSKGDNPASTTDDPTSRVGTNGFALDGGGFSGTVINFSDSSAKVVYDPVLDLSTYTVSGTLQFAKVAAGTHQTTLTITFRGKDTISSAWGDPSIDSAVTGVSLTIDSVAYVSKDGTTRITTYGQVGSTVVGSYSGILQSKANGTTITLAGGKLSALRGDDKKQSSAPKYGFWLEGDGFARQWVELGSGMDASPCWWETADGGYLSVLISPLHDTFDGGLGMTLEVPDKWTVQYTWGRRGRSTRTSRCASVRNTIRGMSDIPSSITSVMHS